MDNSRPDMGNKVVMTSNGLPMDNSREDTAKKVVMLSKPAMDNSRLESLHAPKLRPTQAATMSMSKRTMHMVSAMYYGGMHEVLMRGTEMGAMNGQTMSQKDPNAILNACREVDRGIDFLEGKMNNLSARYTKRVNGTGDTSEDEEVIKTLSEEITTGYTGLRDRIKKIKSDPESGNPRNAPQVGRVQRRLQGAIRQQQQTSLNHRNEMKAQSERALRIVNPRATDEEIRQAAEDPEGGQIFTNAVSSF
jgi:hypothetical protein